jgi:hypothetical protein
VKCWLQFVLKNRTISKVGANMDFDGGCHCGNVQVRVRLSKAPEDFAVRACTCSFCRCHRPRMISDPAGRLRVAANDWDLVRFYRFGTRTCDFLLCSRCGVFIAAVSDADEQSPRAVLNVNCLKDRARFSETPAMHDFDGETLETRLTRRRVNWMPTVMDR